MGEGLSSAVAWRLADALSGGGRRPGSHDGTATVSRVDGEGTVWVRLPGADADTPVNGQMLAACGPGQSVAVRIEGGRLSVLGNASDPAAGTAGVEARVAPVASVASGALEEARRAHDAADAAEADAARAHVAADDAQASADTAREEAEAAAEDAAGAQASAEAAAASATGAQRSADSALYQLSVVEDVVGTVEWLAAHATYSLTSDATVEAGKTYYELSGGSWQPVSPSELAWSATTDATPQEGVTYYTLSDGAYSAADVSGGFASGATYYVASATDPSALGLYEASASESVQAYVASHLALTDEGLWLALDGSAYRMRLSASGWEVLDADGQAVTATLADAQGHVTSTLGRLDGLHLTVTESRLAFSHPNGSQTVEVAWIEVDPETGDSSFHITNAVVMRELRLGSWKWLERAGGNLALKWIGEG